MTASIEKQSVKVAGEDQTKTHKEKNGEMGERRRHDTDLSSRQRLQSCT